MDGKYNSVRRGRSLVETLPLPSPVETPGASSSVRREPFREGRDGLSSLVQTMGHSRERLVTRFAGERRNRKVIFIDVNVLL